jgi:L-ascorbate metabolism protein UlaG (beta-lactamase superfamily)
LWKEVEIYMALTIILIMIGIILLGYLFMSYYPAFGGTTSKAKMPVIQQSKNFSKGKFINQIHTPMEMGIKNTIGLLIDFIKGNPKRKPNGAIPVELLNPLDIQENKQARVTWFGHSALLLELDGKILLLDPMLGKAPSPLPWFGGKRYSIKLPIEIEELPQIDAVLISHDHYDHLDYGSIKKLKEKVNHFFVPLGVGAHLERWGVDSKKISEHDWWDEVKFEGLTLASTPARHFSGRNLTNRDSTLWCSWVIQGQTTKVYFGADSGYGPHFREIGAKYGPFDLTLMECGQYDERWAAIHMMPEETVQAHLDARGKVMLPIHWGAFTLSLHDWTDPVERVTQAAKEHNVTIATPKIGEPVVIGASNYPTAAWWKS